jgi:hypothetical protein
MRYISKYRELRIPIKKTYTKEVDGQVVVVQGESVRFENNLFETDDKNIIDFLDNDKGCRDMIANGIFIKADSKAIKTAQEVIQPETLEEREVRLEKELKELRKSKAKATVKDTEKGKSNKKVAKKDDKPRF